MNNKWLDVEVFVVFALTAIIFFAGGGLLYQSIVRKEAIQHGFAQYNQTTGKWEWKKND